MTVDDRWDLRNRLVEAVAPMIEAIVLLDRAVTDKGGYFAISSYHGGVGRAIAALAKAGAFKVIRHTPHGAVWLELTEVGQLLADRVRETRVELTKGGV